MSTNIFIPKKIKVGFNKREDTYTKKLAYVIYYDQKNKLRKEASWESWRDKNIDPEEYDNEPTTGFVLNKKVGGYQYHYDMRQTYVRVFDPRGFEFEITIPNLLYILENTSSIKGKGLEGEFVYGWDGKDLLLIPTSAPEYQEMQKMQDTLYNGESIKAKDLILGATYATANGTAYVYMGKHDYWEFETNHYRNYCWWSSYNNDYRWDEPLDDTWLQDITRGDNERYRNINKCKKFWFIRVDNGDVSYYSTISKKFYSVINASVSEKFAEYQDVLEHRRDYSPMNYAAAEIVPYTFEEFEEFANSVPKHEVWDYSKSLSYLNSENKISHCSFYRRKDQDSWHCFPHKNEDLTLKELYEKLNPVHLKRYLMNGNLYEGWY